MEQAEQKIDHLDNDRVNEAASVFQDSISQVKALSSNMKGGALQRVYKAVMEFPLMEKYPKFRSDAEQKLFALSLACLQAKNVMVGAVMANRQQAQNAIDEAAKAVSDDAVAEAEKIMRATPEELEQMKQEKGEQ